MKCYHNFHNMYCLYRVMNDCVSVTSERYQSDGVMESHGYQTLQAATPSKTLKTTEDLARNSLVLVACHDHNFHVVVPKHLPEVSNGLWHWTLRCYVLLSRVDSLNNKIGMLCTSVPGTLPT